MTPAVMAFAVRVLTRAVVEGKRVLEVGSRDVNGTVRSHVQSLRPASYVGADIEPGPGVDVISDASQVHRLGRFDVVVSTEMLEHAQDWRAAVLGLKRALAPGGLLVITTRSEGFPFHEYPGDFHRYSVDQLQAILADMDEVHVEPDPVDPGVFGTARRPVAPRWRPKSLRGITVGRAPRPDPSVAFVPADLQGMGRIRSIWPANALGARGWSVSLGNEPRPGAFDVVVLHRPVSLAQLGRMRALQEAGAKVIVQEDDDLSAVGEHVYARRVLDGHPPELLAIHDQAIAECDLFVASTPGVLARYGELAPRSAIVRNYLPRWVGDLRRSHRAGDPIRVTWHGIVDTHLGDLQWLAPSAPAAFRGALFVSIGDKYRTARTLGLGATRVEAFPYLRKIRDYYDRIARCDVTIVPLMPGPRINEAKSALKGQEGMALGHPVVASNVAEYRWLIQDGYPLDPEGGHWPGLIADTPDEFAAHVQTLVRNHELREAMAAAAWNRANGLWLEDHVDEWEAVLRDAVD